MSRVFAYLRVSTADQEPENQLHEIENAGFQPAPYRVISERISGSVPARQRPEFLRLLDRLEIEDVLVVSKLDRLGRDAQDVTKTVSDLAEAGVRVHCLALGGADLTSPAGQLTMGVLAAVAQFERDLLVERTKAGLARAKASGTRLGRPRLMSESDIVYARGRVSDGVSIRALSAELGVSRSTLLRYL